MGYTASKAGAYGTLYLNASSGAYQFVANDAAIEARKTDASESFTLKVTDGSGASDSETLTINITGANDTPPAVIDAASVSESGVINPGNTAFAGTSIATGNVLTNDTDRDTGDTKTVTLVNGSAANVGVTLTGVYGTLAIAANGVYTYTLNNLDADTNGLVQNAAVSEVFNYTMADASGASSTSTLTINITGTNDRPTDIAWTAVQHTDGNDLPLAGALATLSTTDVDNSTGFSYSLLAGSSVNFTVSAAGAVARTTNALAENTTYTLVIRTTDAFGATFDETFNIITGSGGNDAALGGTGDVGDDVLYGTEGNDLIFGGAGNDTLFGQDDDDTLNGGTGADTLYGGANNDTYVVDDAGDVVNESIAGSSGTDTVQSSITYTLGASIENLTLTGTANIDGTGNTQGNTITGNSGNNRITGAGGTDSLNGGAGNDTYVFGLTDGSDTITEGGGTDAIEIVANGAALTSLNFSDDNNGTTNGDLIISVNGQQITVTNHFDGGTNTLETFTFTGGATFAGFALGGDAYTISASDPSGTPRTVDLSATSTNNIVAGEAGVDSISGGNARDLLFGNGGNDVILNGGAGNDLLVGGAGNDTFIFDSALNGSTNVDTISDFTSADDQMSLDQTIFTALGNSGTLAAANFVSGASAVALDANDYIIYDTNTGALYYDAGGNVGAARIQFATLTNADGVTHPTITSADFNLVP